MDLTSEYPDGWKFATIPLDVAMQLMAEHPILANVIVIHDVDPNGTHISDMIEAAGHAGPERVEPETDDGRMCECGHPHGDHGPEFPHVCVAAGPDGRTFCPCNSYTEAVHDPVCHCGHFLSEHYNSCFEQGNESAAGCGKCLCDSSPGQVAEEVEEAQEQSWAESNVLCSFCGHRRGVHRSKEMGHSCAQARCQCVTYVPPPDPPPDIHINASGPLASPWVGGALRDAMRFP